MFQWFTGNGIFVQSVYSNMCNCLTLLYIVEDAMARVDVPLMSLTYMLSIAGEFIFALRHDG